MTPAVKYLSLADAADTASRILGVSEFQAYRASRSDLVVAALDAPAARVDGRDLFESIPLKCAVMFDRLLHTKPYPKKNRQCAFGIVSEFAAMNDHEWRGGVPGPNALAELRTLSQRSESGDPRARGDLARWFDQRLRRGGTARGQGPIRLLFFISHPVSRLDEKETSELRPLVEAVREALTMSAAALGFACEIRVEPREMHNSDMSPPDNYSRDRETILENADAFISVEHTCSGGVALTTWWATVGRIPILHLYPFQLGPGDLMGGLPGNVTHVDYGPSSPAEDIKIAVHNFLRDEFSVISDTPRRRLDSWLLELPLYCAVKRAWSALSFAQRAEAAAISGLTQQRALEAIKPGTRMLGSMSHEEVQSLAATLGIEAPRWMWGGRRASVRRDSAQLDPRAISARLRAAKSVGMDSDQIGQFVRWSDKDLAGASHRLPKEYRDWQSYCRTYLQARP